jgi:anti-anti-sigma regulatory factor
MRSPGALEVTALVHVAATRVGDGARVTCAGRLTRETAEAVAQSLDHAQRACDGPLAVDLAGVTSLDAHGVAVLIGVQAACSTARRPLRITGNSAVARLLERVGIACGDAHADEGASAC